MSRNGHRRSGDNSRLVQLEERIESVSPLVRLLTPGGVIALIPIALSMLGQLEDNRAVSCASVETSRAIVRIDNELSRPEHHELRRLLLRQPPECKQHDTLGGNR